MKGSITLAWGEVRGRSQGGAAGSESGEVKLSAKPPYIGTHLRAILLPYQHIMGIPSVFVVKCFPWNDSDGCHVVTSLKISLLRRDENVPCKG